MQHNTPFQEDFSSPFIPAQTHSADFTFQESSHDLSPIDLVAMDSTRSLSKDVDLFDELIDATQYLQDESHLDIPQASQTEVPFQRIGDIEPLVEAALLAESGGVWDPVWNCMENTGDAFSQFVPERGHQGSRLSELPNASMFMGVTIPQASDALFYDTSLSMDWQFYSNFIPDEQQMTLRLEPLTSLNRSPHSEDTSLVSIAPRPSMIQSANLLSLSSRTQPQAKPKAIQPKPTMSSSENVTIHPFSVNAPASTPASIQASTNSLASASSSSNTRILKVKKPLTLYK